MTMPDMGQQFPGMPGQTQIQNTEASAEEADPSAEPVAQTEDSAEASERTERKDRFSGMPAGVPANGQFAAAQSAVLLAGSIFVLIAAILFAKFYKSNR